MSQAFVVRRGGGVNIHKRATGSFTASITGGNHTVTGVGFAPREVLLFQDPASGSGTYVDLIAVKTLDGDERRNTNGATVSTSSGITLSSDGFTYTSSGNYPLYSGQSYTWIAYD